MKKSIICIMILCAVMSSVMINAEASAFSLSDPIVGQLPEYNGTVFDVYKHTETYKGSEICNYYFKDNGKIILANEIQIRVMAWIGPSEMHYDSPIDFLGVQIKGWDVYIDFFPGESWYTLYLAEGVHPYEAVEILNKAQNQNIIEARTANIVSADEPVIEKPLHLTAGDINANEKIDMTDYILLKRAYFGTYTLDESQKARGDINENSKIDMTDYILLKRMYFGTWVYEERQSTEDEVLPDNTKQANQFKIKVKEFINLEDYKNQNSSSLYGVEITDIRPGFDESKPQNVIDIYYVITTKDSYTAAELTQLFESEDNVLSCMTHYEDLPD